MAQPITPPLDSPCVRNCCLDADDVCVGCGRLLTEITGWSKASADEQQKILDRARQRLRSRNENWPF